MPAPTDPPESASAPSVCVRMEKSCVAEDEQERQPDPDRRDRLGRDPGPDRAAEHVDPECADDRADERREPSPVATIAFAVGVMPNRVSAHGAPR